MTDAVRLQVRAAGQQFGVALLRDRRTRLVHATVGPTRRGGSSQVVFRAFYDIHCGERHQMRCDSAPQAAAAGFELTLADLHHPTLLLTGLASDHACGRRRPASAAGSTSRWRVWRGTQRWARSPTPPRWRPLCTVQRGR